MKTFLSIVILLMTATFAFGQDSISPKKHLNEFGIDASAFVKQFVSLGQPQPYSYYAPTYYLTYRRHFKPGNIRSAIGGSYEEWDIPVHNSIDSNKYRYNSYSIDARVGWEFFSELSKRWQVFYGIDYRFSYSYSKNDANYWNGGYANGREVKARIHGIAPLIGFRFRLTSRLSILTEASLVFIWEQSESRTYYIPVQSQYPPKPDIANPDVKKFYTSFNQPISLFLTFDI